MPDVYVGLVLLTTPHIRDILSIRHHKVQVIGWSVNEWKEA
jgi:hypothetical protein